MALNDKWDSVKLPPNLSATRMATDGNIIAFSAISKNSDTSYLLHVYFTVDYITWTDSIVHEFDVPISDSLIAYGGSNQIFKWCIVTYNSGKPAYAWSFTTDTLSTTASWQQLQIGYEGVYEIVITELKFIQASHNKFVALLVTVGDTYHAFHIKNLKYPYTAWSTYTYVENLGPLPSSICAAGDLIYYGGIMKPSASVVNTVIAWREDGNTFTGNRISTSFVPTYQDKVDIASLNGLLVICIRNCLLYTDDFRPLEVISWHQITLLPCVGNLTKMIVVNNNLLIFGNGYIVCGLPNKNLDMLGLTIIKTRYILAPVTSVAYISDSLWVYAQNIEINKAPVFDFTSLITDRTLADVRLAHALNLVNFQILLPSDKQTWLQQWTPDLKGCINESDLNRVGFAVSFLTSLLAGYGVTVDTDPKTDWKMSDVPFNSSLDQYLSDVVSLKTAIQFDSVDLPITMEYLDFIAANYIEETLIRLNNALKRMADSFLYCNTIFCGQIPFAS